MLKCLLAALACALILQNVCASESAGSHMGKKSNRVNLLSRAVGARMLAGSTTPTDNFVSQTNSFGNMGVAQTGAQSQFVPIARAGVVAQPVQTSQTTFDASNLTPDQLVQLQRFMQQNSQQAQQQQQQQAQQVAQMTVTPVSTPVVQQQTVSLPIQQQQQLQQQQQQQQQMPTQTTTGVEQQLLEQQKMTQKLQEQLKAMQQLQNQQQVQQQNSLAQQLQQFESVQRGNQQPQLNQQPATSLAKSNEKPQLITFQQMQQQGGSSRAVLPTQNTLTTMGVSNTMQQQTLPTTMNTLQQQTMPIMNSLQQQTLPMMNTVQQTLPITQLNTVQQQKTAVGGQQITTGSQMTTGQFQQVQQVPQKQTTTFTQTTGSTATVRDDICASAQPGELFAHPSDPTQFVICYGFGEFTVMDCPDMLVYNDHLKRCDVNTEVPLLCKSNPCLNNGKCSEINSASFKCECNSGFGGQFCEKLDTCSTRPCGTDGVCIPFVLGSPVAHVCLCNGGRTIGTNCQKVEQNPCLTPGSNLRLLNVSFNPSVFAHCEGSRPHFKFCQPPLVFSSAKQTCEWA